MLAPWDSKTSDLRSRAVAVLRADSVGEKLSARAAARCLSGVVNMIAHRHGVLPMQRACADLARYEPAWRSSFGFLPTTDDGCVAEPVQMLAMVARGFLALAGVENMRAALAFWASESDPAVWSAVVGEA